MLTNIHAVIFDLDGLLINSEPLWADADKELLGKRGFIPTEELFLKRLGTGHQQTIEIYKEEFGITEDTQKLMDERKEIFFGLLKKDLSLMSGAMELIQKLFKEDKKLAIATSGPYKEYIGSVIQTLGITSYFSVVVTGEEVKNPKPAPDIFLYAAEKLSVLPSSCLVLEDAPSGVKAAKSAGMIAYGVNVNKEIQSKLKEVGADKAFSFLTEITL